MRIGIDASFLRKPNTGIGQVTTNFLGKLVEFQISNPSADEAGFKFQNEKNEFVLYVEEDIDLKLPSNFQKKVFLPAWKRDDLVRKIWWEKFALPREVHKDECDVFVSLYQSTTILPSKVKHMMVVHDIIPKLFPQYLNNLRKKLYWRLTEKAMRKVDKIVAVSHHTEKDLVQYLRLMPEKISVVYIDVDEIYKKEVTQKESARVLQKYGLEKGYIYHGGGLEVRKNAENLLRAYKELLGNFGKLEKVPPLVISGKLLPQLKPLVTDVEELVKILELEKQVRLLGFAPQEDVPALYANAMLFVYPSRYEGFGLPVLEAMNQGTPVLAGKNSSLPEVGSGSILYCNADDIEDIAMTMRNVLTNEHLRMALSLKGRERAKHFAMEKFVNKILHIAQEIK